MSKEILKKVRQIEIRTKNIVNDFFGGDYHSNFKGRGMTFSEVREYVPGDDVRSIDWNVTARTGKPHLKIFEEERELSVLILIDVSSSGVFGSKKNLKIEQNLMKNKKILILGGTGALGQTLIKRYYQNNKWFL